MKVLASKVLLKNKLIPELIPIICEKTPRFGNIKFNQQRNVGNPTESNEK